MSPHLHLLCLCVLFTQVVDASKAVCLFNTDTQEYLLSAPDGTQYSGLRDVTSGPLSRVANNTYRHWDLIKRERYYHIRNSATQEYLIVSQDVAAANAYFRRRVFTSVDNWGTDNKRGLWNFEAEGANVFIRNVENNGVLYDASKGHVLQPAGGDVNEVTDTHAFFDWQQTERWRKIFVWNGGRGRKVSSGRWRLVGDC